MKHRHFAWFLAALLAWGWQESVRAQQPIPGNYPGGAFTGMKGAMTPGPGSWAFENGTLWYNTQDFVDSDGNALPTDTVNALANRTVIGYATDLKILGGTYFPAVIIPFANAQIRPEPDSRKDFQFGDMIVQPVALGWHHGNLHSQFSYNIWLPTGRFNAGASNNTGKGLYSHMFSGGVTWLQEAERPWAATGMIRYEIFGEQDDTDIEPGDVLTLEASVGRQLSSAWDLGLTAYHQRQVTTEKGSAPGTDTTKYRYSGIGPEINWRPTSVPGFQVGLRAYFEFGARNSSEGVFTVLSLAYLPGK